MWPDGFPTGDYLRQARRRLSASQRAMADLAEMSAATISRIESGASDPTVGTLDRLLARAHLSLLVVDGSAQFVPPLSEVGGDCRDGAERHYPAHLPLVVDPLDGEWWGDMYGLARPPETFYRSRVFREVRRSVSRSAVRHDGPPPRWPRGVVGAAYRYNTWPPPENETL